MNEWREYVPRELRAELRRIEAELKRTKKLSAELSLRRRRIQNLASRNMAEAKKKAALATNAKGKRVVKIKPPRVNKPPARLNKAGLEWKIVSRVFEATANESQ